MSNALGKDVLIYCQLLWALFKNTCQYFVEPPLYLPYLVWFNPSCLPPLLISLCVCFGCQTSPQALGPTFVFPTSTSLCPSPTPRRARSPSPRSPELLGVNVGQRVRRLSSSGCEDRGEAEGEEDWPGELGWPEKRDDQRRQAQLLQIHRELQNVEVILTH